MSVPLLFTWRHFQGDIILGAVRWYLRYVLSYRDEVLILGYGTPKTLPDRRKQHRVGMAPTLYPRVQARGATREVRQARNPDWDLFYRRRRVCLAHAAA
jgi:hypothetical protein